MVAGATHLAGLHPVNGRSSERIVGSCIEVSMSPADGKPFRPIRCFTVVSRAARHMGSSPNIEHSTLRTLA